LDVSFEPSSAKNIAICCNRLHAPNRSLFRSENSARQDQPARQVTRLSYCLPGQQRTRDKKHNFELYNKMNNLKQINHTIIFNFAARHGRLNFTNLQTKNIIFKQPNCKRRENHYKQFRNDSK